MPEMPIDARAGVGTRQSRGLAPIRGREGVNPQPSGPRREVGVEQAERHHGRCGAHEIELQKSCQAR
jgi:hypothetical protein